MDVLAVRERVDQHRIARHVGQQAQLDLGVVRHDELPAFARHERGADLAT